MLPAVQVHTGEFTLKSDSSYFLRAIREFCEFHS